MFHISFETAEIYVFYDKNCYSNVILKATNLMKKY